MFYEQLSARAESQRRIDWAIKSVMGYSLQCLQRLTVNWLTLPMFFDHVWEKNIKCTHPPPSNYKKKLQWKRWLQIFPENTFCAFLHFSCLQDPYLMIQYGLHLKWMLYEAGRMRGFSLTVNVIIHIKNNAFSSGVSSWFDAAQTSTFSVHKLLNSWMALWHCVVWKGTTSRKMFRDSKTA